MQLNPRIALLVIDDRGWMPAAGASFTEHAESVDVWHTAWVDDQAHELGFCGAIREGWRQLREVLRSNPGAFDYVFHLESDFRFAAPFDVSVMAAILASDGDLAQIALKRGPHGEEPEGGFMAAWPDAYVATNLSRGAWRSQDYLRHDLFFTTNPSLYPVEIVQRYDWPEPPACEAAFAHTLLADGWSFAYLGGLTDRPLVEHVGLTRTGHSY